VIVITASAHLSKDGKPPSGNAVESSIQQCVADAVEGSFGEYPKHLRPLLRLRATRIRDESRRHETYQDVQFSFGLPSEMFPVDYGGLQFLVNLLAGDMFPSRVLDCEWSNARVLSIELPTEMRDQAIASFRERAANTIDTIRSTFKLPGNRPLLAFSLKPRVGPTFEEIRQMTLDVLEAGFNIVELDARNLAVRLAPPEDWVRLGVDAAQAGENVTAFSPNLSMPPPQLLEIASTWVETVSPYGPAVMKIDGGLDGLSGLQAVRTMPARDLTPIITCYPTLRNQLRSAIGEATWVDFLSISGADIIYPGGRPTFPNERRPVWGAHVQDWSRAARIYDGMISQQWPMPTIAGGVHPGHLQACYELVGPKVAYFLGGAVALHPVSAKEGAALCVEVVENSMHLADEANAAGNDYAEELPARLLRKLERTRYPDTHLNYFSPANIFSPEVSGDAPKTFYRRWT
jgi:ribulose 1,5-bisphosphate carboxylase large subunit-like protein